MVEAGEEGEDGKGGSPSPFQPKKPSFHLFNTECMHNNLEGEGGCW